ncbi:unnamed protein product [Thelazia callipaeda]|uniref:Uncharacterized protein n=1 Tax=Thelazia callipaeda TaxID=103827 RepID=A0A0N5D574_THECL|nr:unnamed protein product [Thelazia callipaeda]
MRNKRGLYQCCGLERMQCLSQANNKIILRIGQLYRESAKQCYGPSHVLNDKKSFEDSIYCQLIGLT